MEYLESTFVDHNIRLKYDLSINEYCIAEAIFKYHNFSKQSFPSWFEGKKEDYGKLFGISRGAAYNIIKKLKEMNLLLEDDERNLIVKDIWGYINS